jgi:hypothetical protein
MAYHLVTRMACPLLALIAVSMVIGREYKRLWPVGWNQKRWSPAGVGLLTMILMTLTWAMGFAGLWISLVFWAVMVARAIRRLINSPLSFSRKLIGVTIDLLTAVGIVLASAMIPIALFIDYID